MTPAGLAILQVAIRHFNAREQEEAQFACRELLPKHADESDLSHLLAPVRNQIELSGRGGGAPLAEPRSGFRYGSRRWMTVAASIISGKVASAAVAAVTPGLAKVRVESGKIAAPFVNSEK